MSGSGQRRWLRVPSPAALVACAALVISLTGTGIAAVEQLVPRGSVGPAQLRSNAVTSPKIRDGTIGLSEFARTARLPGPSGSAGPSGPAGPKGSRGDKGRRGASADFATAAGPIALPAPRSRTDPIVVVRVARLTIGSPGRYVLWGKALLTPPAAGDSPVRCALRSGGFVDTTEARVFTAGTSVGPVTLTTLLVRELAAPETVDLECSADNGGTASGARIMAVKVRNLTAGGS